MTDQAKDQGLDRREFLKGAVVGGAAAATTTTTLDLTTTAQAQQAAVAFWPPATAGYSFADLGSGASTRL
jgi:secreted PhoX family phosphatase